MKYLSLFFCVLLGSVVFSQELKPIAQNIDKLHQEGAVFPNYDLFEENTSVDKTKKYREMATDATVLELNTNVLSQLMEEQPETFEFAIPYKSSKIVIQLYKTNIFTEEFEAIDQENQVLNYTPGIYYRGVMADDMATSVVAFSFFDNEVVGVASSLTRGNIVVGKTKDSPDYLAYSDHSIVGENPFVCGFEMTDKELQEIDFQPEDDSASKPMISRCVRIYYEIAYQPYKEHGFNVTSTLNWITAIHNNISTLYANDNISISLNSTMVWTTPDPYVYGYNQNLSVFSNYRSNFYGDLGHLVNSPSTTSVAYRNSLCAGNNYAYSAVNQFYEDVPTYSWTIMAMTHEMGHSFGSPHTHACAWNGNNTAIDGCGEQAGHGEGCVGTIPSNGGTIMSYCHLLATGINFSKGFGPQPGQLIRSTINSKNCLGVDCSCVATITSADLDNITGWSVDVNISDNTSSDWNYRVYKYGTTPASWSSTTSTSINISGLTPNTYYVFEMGNVCTSGEVASSIWRLFLTDGNYCAGDKFYDTGGPNGKYGNREEIVKTFYPQVPNDKITMTFHEFDLENGFDYMTLYDGESIAAPVFTNGEYLTGSNIPGPFQATSASGAITVRFVSDPGVRSDGWEAEISCLLGTDEFSTQTDIALYPNPANSIVNIESAETIQSVQVYDMSGRTITKINDINNQKTTLSLNGISNGLYFVKVSAGNKSQILRFVKK